MKSINPLSNAILKVKRAEKHIADVKRAVEAFDGGGSYRTWFDYDSEPGRTLIKLRFLDSPNEWLSCCAADAVQNLRCALDHLAWQVHMRYLAGGGKRLNPKKVVFTISDDRDEYFRADRQGAIESIGGPMWVSFLNKQKPYRGGNEMLYALHLANNLDKHRGILELGKTPVGIAVPSALGTAVSLDGFRRWALEDEVTIASYDGHVQGDNDVDTAFAIVFGDVEGIENEPVSETLDKLTYAVKLILERARTCFFP